MRLIPGALAACLLLSPAAFAGPREEALAVVQRWSEAFAASDVDAITALYAPDALFMGTGSKTVVTDPAAIRRYFEGALLSNRPRGTQTPSPHVMVLSDDSVLVTGLNDTTGIRDGNTYTLEGRVTFVVARRGADWRIVHFHRSALPR